ncbi:hypothetical protein HPB52_022849 [Rhipicephalus sanguineus]|uniref:Uncharacterized protein n=1 Tax=Rhipicephalus sanguineus TaxID=34632 RepID=A0A9D4TBT2_RHISA|nr:hypothetical protein HPB52_022849 [Rhipicephalus sanguineus]
MCSLCKKEYMGRHLVRSGSFFVSLPLEKQLSPVLSSKSTSNAVLDTLERAPGDSMRDIIDGQHYHATRSEVGMAEHDLTLTLNSDGSPIFESSKYSIWPVQAITNELPSLLRWKNVVAPSLWYGKEHPNMTLLL